MTLESTQNKNRYIGNGSTKSFAFSFKVWKKSEVAVWVGNGSSEQEVSASCHISITASGGTVTFPVAPASGKIIVIRRNMPYIQEDDYKNGTRFDSEDVEDRFDQDCAERQDLKLDLGRAIKIPNTSDMDADDLVQALLEAIAMMREAGDISGASLIQALGSLVYRALAAHLGDWVNVKNFGAKGDGTTDDTAAWTAWKSALEFGGMGYVPSGTYLVNNVRKEFKYGAIGNFKAGDFDVERWTQTVNGDVPINLGRLWDVQNASEIAPSIVVENEIDTTNTSSSDNCAVCGYFAHTQTGENSSNATFSTSLITTAVSNAKGDNDVIACSNRAIRHDKPGCYGDCAGVGGRIDTGAHQKGGSMGAEFAVHITQNIGVPCPSDFSNASTSKWVTPIHITGSTAGSPATAAILIQGSRTSSPWWDGIQFSYTMFPSIASPSNPSGFLKNEIPNVDGSQSSSYPGVTQQYETVNINGTTKYHVPNTVAINMASFSEKNGFPDTCLKLGYAKRHIWTPNSFLKVQSFGIDCAAKSNISLRLDALETNSHTHGTTSVAFREDGTTKAYISYEDHAVKIANRNLENENSGPVALVLHANAFRPSAASDKVSLGNSAYRYQQLYVSSSSISTSDERIKEVIEEPTEALMRAWGAVRFKVFQFKDSIAEKGSENARLHVGVIAQDVISAFEDEDLDASRYGLFCHDVWQAEEEKWNEWDEEVPAEYDEDGEIITEATVIHHRDFVSPAVEAGDLYSIRYEEALALECAYQRWRLGQIEARLAVLEGQ